MGSRTWESRRQTLGESRSGIGEDFGRMAWEVRRTRYKGARRVVVTGSFWGGHIIEWRIIGVAVVDGIYGARRIEHTLYDSALRKRRGGYGTLRGIHPDQEHHPN